MSSISFLKHYIFQSAGKFDLGYKNRFLYCWWFLPNITA